MIGYLSRLPQVAMLCLGVMVAACSSNGAVAPAESLPAAQNEAYRLGTGDQLRITVFGQPDLSVESVEVDSSGRLSLPLVGDLLVLDRTVEDVEQMIVDELSPEFLKNPIVSAEVLVYRDFFILGEVAQPGPYPYRGKMTVIAAVAMAGGFTYRAVEDEFVISRDGQRLLAAKETLVLPGDVIEVAERYF